jgi:hypothetical protein
MTMTPATRRSQYARVEECSNDDQTALNRDRTSNVPEVPESSDTAARRASQSKRDPLTELTPENIPIPSLRETRLPS